MVSTLNEPDKRDTLRSGLFLATALETFQTMAKQTMRMAIEAKTVPQLREEISIARATPRPAATMMAMLVVIDRAKLTWEGLWRNHASELGPGLACSVSSELQPGLSKDKASFPTMAKAAKSKNSTKKASANQPTSSTGNRS
jgi:hypothetical protein